MYNSQQQALIGLAAGKRQIAVRSESGHGNSKHQHHLVGFVVGRPVAETLTYGVLAALGATAGILSYVEGITVLLILRINITA